MPGENVLTECPISTTEGVKGCDVAWISQERLAPMNGAVCFTSAPEICVEILSPSNSKAEIEEKTRLYFEAGASEVWICEGNGRMTFHIDERTSESSKLCPNFPKVVERKS